MFSFFLKDSFAPYEFVPRADKTHLKPNDSEAGPLCPELGHRIRRNRTNYMKNTSKIACLSLIAASAMHAGADNFTPLVLPDRDTDIRAFSDGTTYAPLFSAG